MLQFEFSVMYACIHVHPMSNFSDQPKLSEIKKNWILSPFLIKLERNVSMCNMNKIIQKNNILSDILTTNKSY